MKTHHENDVLMFWDILIPGEADWPSASQALHDAFEPTLSLNDADRVWLLEKAAALQRSPPDLRCSGMLQLETAERERFRRVLVTLYEAYYTSPLVHAAVLRLAEAGPREASASFDESQLRQVMLTRAGQRRM
jgi:hypothetical protein